MVNLFQSGEWKLASDLSSEFKIEGEALGDVPRGGLKLAAAMEPYVTVGPLVVCNDVWASGGSWERQRAGRAALGAIAFARSRVLDPRIHIFATVDFGEPTTVPTLAPYEISQILRSE